MVTMMPGSPKPAVTNEGMSWADVRAILIVDATVLGIAVIVILLIRSWWLS